MTVKDPLERLMHEELELYLEEHPTKANGYYTRDLLTLVGPVEDLRVPACERGIFISRSSRTGGVLP